MVMNEPYKGIDAVIEQTLDAIREDIQRHLKTFPNAYTLDLSIVPVINEKSPTQIINRSRKIKINYHSA